MIVSDKKLEFECRTERELTGTNVQILGIHLATKPRKGKVVVQLNRT